MLEFLQRGLGSSFGEVLPPLPSLQSLFRNFLDGLCVVHDPLEFSSESSAQWVAQQRERFEGVELGEWQE